MADINNGAYDFLNPSAALKPYRPLSVNSDFSSLAYELVISSEESDMTIELFSTSMKAASSRFEYNREIGKLIQHEDGGLSENRTLILIEIVEKAVG